MADIAGQEKARRRAWAPVWLDAPRPELVERAARCVWFATLFGVTGVFAGILGNLRFVLAAGLVVNAVACMVALAFNPYTADETRHTWTRSVCWTLAWAAATVGLVAWALR